MRTASPDESGYIPIAEIARGGMGTVWAVLRREGSFERLYAMKRLRESYREDSAVRHMFTAEARIAGLIRHPNVVSVLDVGEDAEGPFLVMDYVDGVTVSKLIRRLRSIDQRLPAPLAMQIVADSARGLSAAHGARGHDGVPVAVVHRDVSPQNLLVGFDGVVRVTDFGVAKVLGHLAQTADGVLKGKLGYMAPEQLRFEELDHRCDLFGLGVVLFELLSGQRLYGGEGVSAARQILNDAPPDIGEVRADLPPALVGLLFSMLAKDPSERPATADAVAQHLDRIRAAMASEADVPPLAEYLAALFAADRDAERERLTTAVRTASVDAMLAAVAEEAPTLRRPPRRRAVWFGAAVLLVVGLPLLGYAVGAGEPAADEPAEDPSHAATAAPLDSPTSTAAAPARVEAGDTIRAIDGEPARDEREDAVEEASASDAPSDTAVTKSIARSRRGRARARARRDAEARSRDDATMDPARARSLPRDDIWSTFE